MSSHGFQRRKPLAAALIGAAFFLLLLPSQTRADDGAAALLAKHKAFVGWQFGDGSINTLRLERQVTNSKGAEISKAVELHMGLAFRRDLVSFSKQSDEDSSTGFTGRIFWTTSSNGFTVPLVGDNAQYQLAYDVLLAEGTPELPATMHGTGSVDGKTVPIVRVTMQGALPMDLYVDPDTGAYLRAVIDPEGTNETTIRVNSYANIAPGKKMIGSWSFGDSKNVYQYTKLTPNANFAASELHPPTAVASWTFANPAPFPIKATQDRIYVDATVNGVHGRFLLDTGASSIVLTDDFANRAHVKTIDRSRAAGIGGETTSLVRKADTIVIGGNTLSNAYVDTLNEKFDEKGYGENLDGLIGFDLFGGAIINLKLSAQTMSIGDPASTEVPQNAGYVVTPDLSTLQPRVPVKIGGKIDAIALLDSGSAEVFVSPAIERHGVVLVTDREHQFLGGNVRVRGVGGDQMVQCGQLTGINVGPIRYTSLTACEDPTMSIRDALIGFDFIKNFDYIFDYPHGQLVMTPHQQ
jgi:hypothetical protein